MLYKLGGFGLFHALTCCFPEALRVVVYSNVDCTPVYMLPHAPEAKLYINSVSGDS